MTSSPARAHASLLGLALGDALGMPTQSFSRDAIVERYGTITGLVDAVADQPIAPGLPAGTVTDDTEQAVLLGRLLIAGGGHVDPAALAAALIDWEQGMIARGSRDLLGPSTKAALTALQAGMSAELTGRSGTTNGAAMRVAPVGIAHPVGPGLIAAVVEACQVTHSTGLGISGACAIASAVSSGIDGADVGTALEAGIEAARIGREQGVWIAGASIPDRTVALRPLATDLEDEAFAHLLTDVVGTSVQSQESVVAALLIIDRFRDRPFAGLCCAASIGGDTDTIAAMAGAVLGACCGPDAFPAGIGRTVEDVNHLGLEQLALSLIDLRAAEHLSAPSPGGDPAED